MTEIFLMETLAAFVEEHTKNIILEVEVEPGAAPWLRLPVFRFRVFSALR